MNSFALGREVQTLQVSLLATRARKAIVSKTLHNTLHRIEHLRKKKPMNSMLFILL